MKKYIIVIGSARSKGHTKIVVDQLAQHLSAAIVDLKDYKIAPYNYDNDYSEDDFLPLIDHILEYDLIILASPIYWYSMSGLMKTFLDRITDLLHYHENRSNTLKSKSLAALSCGSEEKETEGYFKPFELTAEYLGMRYCGQVHTWMHQMELLTAVEKRIENFANQLL